jgi:hypothetical protein
MCSGAARHGGGYSGRLDRGESMPTVAGDPGEHTHRQDPLATGAYPGRCWFAPTPIAVANLSGNANISVQVSSQVRLYARREG